MVECIFTIDYEIYGNGEGSLQDLVFEPAEKLVQVFHKWNARFVSFVEVAELEMIENNKSDLAIDLVKRQICGFYNEGFEIGLHLHPQWYKAKYEGKAWHLDYDEYNLCVLSPERITQIVERAIKYLRYILGVANFTPLSYRAGNGLFQPSKVASTILGQNGIRIDSSVLKGNVQRNLGMDYRDTLRNGYFWPFGINANTPDPMGNLIEIPIYTLMMPFWKMITPKRVAFQRKIPSHFKAPGQKLNRYLDFLRFRYPLKLDFCRMTLKEMILMLHKAIQEDMNDPMSFRPIVATGHTKELSDLDSIDSFLHYLHEKRIKITTFSDVYTKCQSLV